MSYVNRECLVKKYRLNVFCQDTAFCKFKKLFSNNFFSFMFFAVFQFNTYYRLLVWRRTDSDKSASKHHGMIVEYGLTGYCEQQTVFCNHSLIFSAAEPYPSIFVHPAEISHPVPYPVSLFYF